MDLTESVAKVGNSALGLDEFAGKGREREREGEGEARVREGEAIEIESIE